MQTPLLCHPATPDDIVAGITVEVDSLTSDLLVLDYRIRGDLDRLLLPPQAASRFQDLLWQHTCLEAFIGFTDSDDYFEFNFSPSSQWAAYRFESYRKNVTSLNPLPPQCSHRVSTLCVKPRSVMMTPSPRHAGHAPSELALNSDAFTPLAFAKAVRIVSRTPV